MLCWVLSFPFFVMLCARMKHMTWCSDCVDFVCVWVCVQLCSASHIPCWFLMCLQELCKNPCTLPKLGDWRLRNNDFIKDPNWTLLFVLSRFKGLHEDCTRGGCKQFILTVQWRLLGVGPTMETWPMIRAGSTTHLRVRGHVMLVCIHTHIALLS